MASGSAQKVAAFPQSETSPDVLMAEAHEQMATLAYLKAEARGFTPGQELGDWLEAENEFNAADKAGRKH